jgi:MFS family permease
VGQIGLIAAAYPAVWGAAQLVTGAASDRWGRKWFIAAGMLVQAAALAMVASGSTFEAWLAAAVSVVAVLTALSGIVVAVRMRGGDHRGAAPLS